MSDRLNNIKAGILDRNKIDTRVITNIFQNYLALMFPAIHPATKAKDRPVLLEDL